ncbi:MAG: DsbA family protein [Magnetovibrio sp.]|nr:DsbA family protein [Magnetovibrio sp.]
MGHQDFLKLSGKHILYFGDPMCSWCWGFSATFKHIIELVADQGEVHMIMTGLRPHTSQAWDDELRFYIRQHWQTVAQETGQSFDFSRFEDADFIYNTEPACRALVAARTLDSKLSFSFFEALQHHFYALGEDITKQDVLVSILHKFSLDQAAFEALFQQISTQDQTQADFKLAKDFNVTGYPSVLLLENGQVQVLTRGYQTFESLRPRLQEWLND